MGRVVGNDSSKFVFGAEGVDSKVTRIDLKAIQATAKGPIWRDTVTLVILLILTASLTLTLTLVVERVRRTATVNRQQEEHIESIDKRLLDLEDRVERLEKRAR